MVRRSGGRNARLAQRAAPLAPELKPVKPGESGGQFEPLKNEGVAAIRENIFRILAEVGFADATLHCIEACSGAGAILGDDRRLRMPRDVVQQAISLAEQKLVLHGQFPEHDLQISGQSVHFATAGPKQVCMGGEGHYLGSAQTLKVMQSEYLYPDFSDRDSPLAWAENGKPVLLDKAIAKKKQILDGYFPSHISDEVDQHIRAEFPVFLSRQAIGR